MQDCVGHSCTLVPSYVVSFRGVCSVSFVSSLDFVCVCVWNSAIFGNGWHAWMGLGDIFGFFQFGGVCPSGWTHTLYVTHATGTPMHDLVRNGLALSPLLSPYCYLPNENTDTRYFCFCGPLHSSAVLFYLLPFGPSQYSVSFSFSPFFIYLFFGRTTTSASVDNVPAPISRACWM